MDTKVREMFFQQNVLNVIVCIKGMVMLPF